MTPPEKQTRLLTSVEQASLGILPGSGEMGVLMRDFDWNTHPLGPPDQWPQSLKAALSIILSARYPMFIWWGETLINLYNDAYIPVLGKKHPKALGKPAQGIWHEIWDQVGPLADKVMRQNEASFMEDLPLFMERNGYLEETYFTFSYSPIVNDQGRTGGVFCACTEETRRVFNERQMALLRKLAASVAEARTLEAVYKTSAGILGDNPQDIPFALIYRLDAEQKNVYLAGMTGVQQDHAVAPETLALDTSAIWPFLEVKRTGDTVIVSDLRQRFKWLPTGVWDCPPTQAAVLPITQSGQTGLAGFLVLGLNPFRLFDEDYQAFVNFISAHISASVTNAQAYEEERRRIEALAEIDRTKTAFFSNVSHEFRTPLTLMLSPLEDTLQGTDITPMNRQRLDMVHRNALRLQKLVNTLLDFSSIEAGRLQALYQPTDLSVYTSQLANMFESVAYKAGLKLNINCPPLPEPLYVDANMWEKIVLNLVSNAYKHTFEGGISVSTRWVGEAAELIVRDTGVGIPENQLADVLTRFYRVSGTRSRTHEGSGIGLALVNELVKLHGGRIDIASAVDQGTTVTVRIPMGKAHLPPDRIRTKAAPISTTAEGQTLICEALSWAPDDEITIIREVGGAQADSQPVVWKGTTPKSSDRARLILADDNADLRAYISALLSPYCVVETVSNGIEALESALREPPDLLLSDVMMPGMDGFELLNAFRGESSLRSIPVILLSARAGEDERVEGIQAGADDYLIKPFNARELLAKVKSNLDLYRVRRQAIEREQSAIEIIDSIRSNLDLESILRKAVTRLGQLSLADRCAFWLYKPDTDEFEAPRYEYHSEQCVASISETANPRSPVLPNRLSHQEVLRYRDIVMAEGLTDTDRQMIRERDIKSLLHVPILYKGNLLGTLRMHTIFQHREWDDETISLILYLGAQMAVAIYQAQLLERLRESEARKTAVFESSLDAITTMDHQGKVVDWNASAERMFGYSREQAIGRDLAELIIPERLRQAHCDGISHYLKTGEGPMMNKLLEMPALRSDGSEFISELTISRAPSEGQPLFTGTLRDITDRKRFEQDLRESELRFRNLADTAPMYMAMADEHGNAVYFNRPWLEFTGKKMDEMLGMQWLCVLHPEDAPRFERDFRQAFSERIPIHEQYRFRRADGEYRWMLAVGAPRFTQDGRFIGYFGTYADFHDLKEAQLALSESEHRFRTLAEALPQLIWTARPDGNLEYFNQRWYEFTGLTVEQSQGEGWSRLLYPDDRERTLTAWHQAVNTGKRYETEYRLYGANGHYRWFLARGVPIYDESGKLVQWFGSCTDIENQKQAERELEQFAIIASHDLQEPLRKILIFGDMLSPMVASEGEDYLRRMQRAASRMQHLITDLLTLSRINQKGKELQRIDLNHAVSEALDHLQVSLDETDAHVSVTRLGQAYGDYRQIQQLLQNLLSNAIKYRHPDKPPVIKIYGQPSRDGLYYQLTVEDEGIGIKEAYFGRIFEPFERLHGLDRYPGTGMGLAICKEILKRHKGTISVKSKPNQGSQFTISLPTGF